MYFMKVHPRLAERERGKGGGKGGGRGGGVKEKERINTVVECRYELPKMKLGMRKMAKTPIIIAVPAVAVAKIFA